MSRKFEKDLHYAKFCAYGFLKNLRFFEPFLYLFFLEKGLSYLQIGTLITVREIVRNIFEIPSGIISDAFGRRRTMIASFTMYLLSFVVFYFSGTYGFLILAMIFFAVGDSFRTGTHKAMIFTWLEIRGWTDQKVDYYGHTRSWSQRGSALSSLLAAVIVFWSGQYRTAFLISGIPYLLDLLLMISYPAALEGPVRQTPEIRLKEEISRVFRQIFHSFRNLGNIRLLMNTSLYSGVFRAVKDYLQPVLAALAGMLAGKLAGFSAAEKTSVLVGVVYFFLYLGTARASKWSGKFSEYFNPLSVALNFTLLTGMIVLFFAGGLSFLPYPWKWLVLIPFLILFLLENVRRPVAVACISEALPGDILATTLSVESQTRSLVTALVAPALGFLIDKTGIGTGLLVLAIFLFLIYPLVYLKPTKKIT